MKKLTVGQVLYILVPGEMNIHPARVVEEVNRKTLRGEEVNYTIELFLKGKRSVVPLDPDVLTFAGIHEAKDHLLENAKRAVEKICDTARKISLKEFPSERPDEPQEIVKNVVYAPVQEAQSVLLDNGMVAKIHLPPEFSE